MRVNPSLLTPLFSSLYCCAFFLVGGRGLYLVQQLEVKTKGGWKSLGIGSTRLRRGGGTRTKTLNGTELGSDQVAIAISCERGKLTVTLTSSADERVLDLDKRFLLSSRERVTYFKNGQGCVYRITHWGERDCDQSEAAPALRVIRNFALQRTVHAAAG